MTRSMWRKLLVFISVTVTIGDLAQAAPGVKRSYELLPDGDRPSLFAEGIISTPGDEAGGVFSPDGSEFYFARLNPTTTFPRIGLLCVARWNNGSWSSPEVLPFSGKYLDLLPRLSPDGQTMYFTSSRPTEHTKSHVLRIWKVERVARGWSDPQPLAAPINAPDDRWNSGASVTEDGTMYFTSDRQEAGHPQIYRARSVNGIYENPERLGPEINSAFNEYDPYVNAEESLLFFVSSGEGGPPFGHRADTLYGGGFPYARGDIYVSRRIHGKWTAAQHLEHDVNSVAEEGAPALTPDEKYFVFSSERSPFVIPMPHRISMAEFERFMNSTQNGHGNIYTIPVSALGVKAKSRKTK